MPHFQAGCRPAYGYGGMRIHQPGHGLFFDSIVPHLQHLGFLETQQLESSLQQPLRLVFSMLPALVSTVVVSQGILVA